MNILLDTSVLLNWIGNSPMITERMRDAILAERNSIFYSPLSIWEARIKWAKGRLQLPGDLLGVIADKDFAELRFTCIHAEEAGRLPAIHADPFDRGLIAQARSERLTLLTSDRLIGRYDVKLEFA